jgi:hypothetical protein
MEQRTVNIPGDATYSPVALTDVLLAAPIASELLLGMTLPGRIIQAAALGAYAGSAVKDWVARKDMKRVDFLREYGADVFDLERMPREERLREIAELAPRLNDVWVDVKIPRPELAKEVNRRLSDYLAAVTGQRVETSSELRNFSIAYLIFPFAYGTCDIISGDVAIFKDTGIFEPHIITHEFCHRKGYWKELHAQALAYLALVTSGEPVFVQSALAERLHRHLRVLGGDDSARFGELVDTLKLRPELNAAFRALRPEPGAYESAVSKVMRNLYDQRMRLTGQNGLSDYDEGFTSFLWTFGRSTTARQPGTMARL